MAEYIRKDAVMWITTELGAWETQNRVRDLPVEDVQPVKRGRWENTNTPNQLRCSKCEVIHFIAQYPHGETVLTVSDKTSFQKERYLCSGYLKRTNL